MRERVNERARESESESESERVSARARARGGEKKATILTKPSCAHVKSLAAMSLAPRSYLAAPLASALVILYQ